MDSAPREPRFSHWPHRLAIALALVTFPLIWVGGLVTTYDAGMAVPDWPGTFGYNLLLYPWQSWLAAPWDLFIEHGHRLLGAAAGFVAIALVVVTCLTDRRRHVQALAAGALLLVIFQGVLGGARVLLDERLVALVHGCVGPLFFAYLAALIVVTSRWWSEAESPSLEPARFRSLVAGTWFVAALAFGQLALGAVLRHLPLTAPSGVFRAALLLHLIVAGVLAVQVGIACWRVGSVRRATRGLSLPVIGLPLLIAVQLCLGGATYVAKYSFPSWLAELPFAAGHVVQEKSLWQSLTITAHVATGSLILFCAVLLATRVARLAARSVGQARTSSAGPPLAHFKSLSAA